MGKVRVGPHLEIIPIGGTGPSHKSAPPSNVVRMPYLFDNSLVPRVQRYLESNVDKTYVDINVMADDLQRTYREYGRLKSNSFRASVKKAYTYVMQSYGLETNANGSSEDTSEDSITEEQEEAFNETMNNQLINLYMSNKRNSVDKHATPAPRNLQANESIDISSDDSDEEGPPSPPPAQQQRVSLLPTPSDHSKHSKNDMTSVAWHPRSSHSRQNEDVVLPPRSASHKRLGDKKESSSNRSKKRKQNDGTALPLPPMSNVRPNVFPNAFRRKKSVSTLQMPQHSFKDLAGINDVLENVCKLVMHVRHPEIYREVGVPPPTGFLLHGPPGCGKTLLANAIAGELQIPLLKVSAPELVAGVSGESEERIRDLFDEASATAPCVLFIDEIDVITPNRQNAQKEMERRIVAQILSCLDELNQHDTDNRALVIGATNRPDAIDPSLRRAGRFDREIRLGFPNVDARAAILKMLTKDFKLSENFDYQYLARMTPGFVGADLSALTREAAMNAISSMFAKLVGKAGNKSENKSEHIETILDESPVKQQSQQTGNSSTIADNTAPENVSSTVPPAGTATSASVETNGHHETRPLSQTSGCSDTNKSDTAEIIVDDDIVETVGDSNTERVVVPDDDAAVSIDDDEPKSTAAVPANALESAAIVLTDDDTPSPKLHSGKRNQSHNAIGSNRHTNYVCPFDGSLGKLLGWLHNTSTGLSNDQLRSLCITMEDFTSAISSVQPSAQREGFATVPNVTWNDVGSLYSIRAELQSSIIRPVKYAAQYAELGVSVPAGVLLCGPPGCGKTLLAKAVANEAGINFISIKGPELLNMYVGESERAIRVCFERARNSKPCVIFFDEFDALCPKRSDTREGGTTMRIVNQLLTEMDGIECRKEVFLLAATNRPDIIDPAVLRPGRFDKVLYVGIPTPSDRAAILKALTKDGTKPPMASDVDLEEIAMSSECTGYTGADLAALVREASTLALEDFEKNEQTFADTDITMDTETPSRITVNLGHFKRAIQKICPSVTDAERQQYDKLRKLYASKSKDMDEEMEI